MDTYLDLKDYLNNNFIEVSGYDLYRSIFPDCENKGELHTDFSHPNAIYLYMDSEKGKLRRRIMLKDTWENDFNNYVLNNTLTLCSGLSYRGRANKLDNAQRMHALVFDIDSVGIEEFKIIEGRWNIDRKYFRSIPKPTYISLSGTGIHIYYVFKNPIDLYPNIKIQLKSMKYDLTEKIWEYGETSQEKSIQYQSINQSFRMPGSFNCKDGSKKKVVCFRIGDEVTLEYMNSYVSDINNIVDLSKPFKPTQLSMIDSMVEYPEWYQRVIVEKNRKRKKWDIDKKVNGSDPYALYHWWINKRREIVGGHRYYFLMCMAIYADKCNVPKSKLKKDMKEIFDELSSIPHKNPLTENDMKSALEAYSKEYYDTSLKEIEYWSGLKIEKNKRNNRTRYSHLQDDYWITPEGKKVPNYCKVHREFALKIAKEEKRLGRQKKIDKSHIVADFRKNNPYATPKECIEKTGLNKNTVYRWWKKTFI